MKPIAKAWEIASAALLLCLYVFMALTALGEKGNMVDEVAHVTGGYSYWLTGEHRFHPENGILPQRLAALPLLGQGYAWPDARLPEYRTSDTFAVGNIFFYRSGNDASRMLASARAGMALVGLAVGITVWASSRHLFGAVGGLISLAMFTFCPTMLAHGCLATSDMTAALFFLLAAGSVWSLMREVTVSRVAAAGAAMAGLFLSKYSAILIFPVVAALLAIRMGGGTAVPLRVGTFRKDFPGRWARLGMLCASILGVFLISWILIWAAYGGRYMAVNDPSLVSGQTPFWTPWETMAPSSPIGSVFVDAARALRALPEAFLYGFQHVVHYGRERQAFLHGEFGFHGWWWFFPYAVLVKTPVSVFALLLLAVALAIHKAKHRAGPKEGDSSVDSPEILYRSTPLWLLLAVYWAAAIASSLNVGHRHVLLTYPVAYIFCGVLGPSLWERSGKGKAILATLLMGLAVESWAVRPHYLAFFNSFAGGPGRGYEHLVDSSLDWGQDLPELKRWLDRNATPGPGRPAVHLSYFGTSSPEYYGIEAVKLPGCDLVTPLGGASPDAVFRGGLYCISASLYQSLYHGTPGPWTEAHEKLYRTLLPLHAAMEATREDPGARAALLRKVPGESVRIYPFLPAMKMARLCAWLRRNRPRPDAHAGYSILIFRLEDREVRQALEGPMPVDPLTFKL